MLSKRIFWLMAASGLWAVALAKDAPRMAPVPADPLELVTGQIQAVDTPTSREADVQLLSRARDGYSFRNAGHGYDLKVSFTVNSGGQTEYDGAWEMEDIFDPQQGLRWTAQAEAGYSTTQISSNGMFYGVGTASTFPLRLQEARAALFGPIPAAGFVNQDSLRTSTSTLNGIQVTCVLLSGPQSGVATTSGWSDAKVRLWYAQAYSVVRYLIRTQYRSSFYKFASYIRDGRPVPEALYRAYGAPYTRIRALEIAWRHEVSRGALDKLPAGN